MKTLLLAILLLAVTATTTHAQKNDEWRTVKEENGIVVKFKYTDCDPEAGFDQESVLLQVTNTTNDVLTVDWDLQLWYNGVCKTCEDPYGEYVRTIEIGAGAVMEGTCSIRGDYRFNIFSKFTDPNFKGKNPDELTRFELANFKVTKFQH